MLPLWSTANQLSDNVQQHTGTGRKPLHRQL